MTTNPYDTAWVACVRKTVNDQPQYLFPSAVRTVLQSQQQDGGWSPKPRQVTHNVDEILCTLAAIHALCVFESEPGQVEELSNSSKIRISLHRGLEHVSRLLKQLHLGHCQRVGFEILLPGLLDALVAFGHELCFPTKASLYAMRQKKLAKLAPDTLYSSTPSTLVHSMEAFFASDEFQFDKMSHHKVGGSMMGSPSATAAYLMKASSWDEDAEAYLRLAFERGAGHGRGGFPSAFPSTYFETIWVSMNRMFSVYGVSTD